MNRSERLRNIIFYPPKAPGYQEEIDKMTAHIRDFHGLEPEMINDLARVHELEHRKSKRGSKNYRRPIIPHKH